MRTGHQPVRGSQRRSFPAFFLPFQDISTHNHTPQWTQEVANMPVPDGGVCIPVSGGCQNDRGGACCASSACGADGTRQNAVR
jgi:hypothetical protein